MCVQHSSNITCSCNPPAVEIDNQDRYLHWDARVGAIRRETICLIHGDLTDSARYLPSPFHPPTLHNDASRIRYDLTPYSLLYIIQMDFPDINTVYHPVSHNTFVPEWLAVAAQHNALCCVCCDVFGTIFDMMQKYQRVVICAFRGATCSSSCGNSQASILTFACLTSSESAALCLLAFCMEQSREEARRVPYLK